MDGFRDFLRLAEALATPAHGRHVPPSRPRAHRQLPQHWVKLEAGAWVVVNDLWHPWWPAEVDGRQAQLPLSPFLVGRRPASYPPVRI